MILSTRSHPYHNNTIQSNPNQTNPNQTNPIRVYPGGGGGVGDNKEEKNDDKKEDRIKYNTHMMMMTITNTYAGADAFLLFE